MVARFLFALLLLTQSSLWATEGAVRDEEPKIVEEIRSLLPADWECHYEPGAGTKFRPVGLPRPDFVIVVLNPKLVVHREQIPKRGLWETTPNLPLSFYPIAQKTVVLETIEKQRRYSWSTPSYFGETPSHVVVTSPAWVNQGHYSLESRRSLRPILVLLRPLIAAPDDRSSMVTMLMADPELGR